VNQQERDDRADGVLVAQLREIVAMLTGCCEDAAAREWALGVQCDALKARLKLAEGVVGAARRFLLGCDDQMSAPAPSIVDALAAYDAVPGDVGPVDLG